MQQQTIESLKALTRGPVIEADDPQYDSARAVYNAMHDKRPFVIVQAADTADVVATVNFAREQQLLLAVRGGGHSVPGYGTCDGGVVLDLGRMRGVQVNQSNRRVRVGGGATLGDLDHATHAYGLAVPGGTVSTTGLAGLTLGGGMGHLSRGCGLTIDNLVSAELVTASGDILVCSDEQNADLFWAMRGGGGNFGVTTSFEFRGHEIHTVLGGPTVFPIDDKVMRNWSALMIEAPEQLNALLAIALCPPMPFVPEEWHGCPVMIVLTCWCGSQQQDDTIAPMIAGLGDMVAQGLWRMPYPEINMFFDELLPAGLRHYWKANSTREMTDEAISIHVEYGPRVGNPESGMFAFPINGACHRVDDGATAFANRHTTFSPVIAGTWHDAADDEAYIAWVRDYHQALEPYSDPGGYVNFMSDDDQEIATNYGDKYDRLKSIKAKYDPENLFRLNQNIEP